jgi:hypothetical protein
MVAESLDANQTFWAGSADMVNVEVGVLARVCDS